MRRLRDRDLMSASNKTTSVSLFVDSTHTTRLGGDTVNLRKSTIKTRHKPDDCDRTAFVDRLTLYFCNLVPQICRGDASSLLPRLYAYRFYAFWSNIYCPNGRVAAENVVD